MATEKPPRASVTTVGASTPAQAFPRSARIGCASLLAAAVVIAIIAAVAGGGGKHAASPAQAPVAPVTLATPAPDIALLAAQCQSDGYGFERCQGSVQNLADTSIRNVVAVIELLATATGPAESSGEALISYNPLLAGQTSPWSVLVRENPALTYWRVRFRTATGGTLTVLDKRPAAAP